MENGQSLSDEQPDDDSSQTIPDEDESDAGAEAEYTTADTPDIAEVVASLKASVGEDPESMEDSIEDSGDGAEGDLEEMQKIRRILDDLE